MNPGNVGWKLTAGESFYDIPDLFTGCFESGEDSIEMLLGMKEFDGQEGIGALTDKMIPSPSERSCFQHYLKGTLPFSALSLFNSSSRSPVAPIVHLT